MARRQVDPTQEIHHEGVTDRLVVPTGGPFYPLLVFSSDRVIEAEWWGQR